jgi:hypothetical protein
VKFLGGVPLARVQEHGNVVSDRPRSLPGTLLSQLRFDQLGVACLHTAIVIVIDIWTVLVLVRMFYPQVVTYRTVQHASSASEYFHPAPLDDTRVACGKFLHGYSSQVMMGR